MNIVSKMPGALIYGFAASIAGAQPSVRTVEIPDAVACVTCSVTVTTVLILGRGDGPGSLEGPPAAVHLDPLNRYWVVPGNGPPMVYDSIGRFTGHIGSSGRGPGEFIGPAHVRFWGRDSIFVLDYGTRRISVLATDFTPRRTFASQLLVADLIPFDGAMIGTGYIRTPASAGFPLHVLTLSEPPSSPVVSSFGPRRDGWRAAKPSALEWLITAGVSHAFWTADVDEYRVVGWAAPGVDAVEFLRRPDWFRERSPMVGGGSNTPPPPMMRDLIQDSEGLLWVAGLSASTQWREAWAESMRGAAVAQKAGSGIGEAPARGTAWIPRRHTNIEVIDPNAARVLTRFRMEGENLVTLLPSRRAALYSEDSIGYPRLRIVQFELARR